MATVDVTGQEFYGPGYDDSDKRIPDMTIIKRQLGKRFTKAFLTIFGSVKGGFHDGFSSHVVLIARNGDCQEVILIIWWSDF